MQSDVENEKAPNAKIEEFLKDEAVRKVEDANSLPPSLSEVKPSVANALPNVQSPNPENVKGDFPHQGTMIGAAQGMLDELGMKYGRDYGVIKGGKNVDGSLGVEPAQTEDSDSSLSPRKIAEKMEKAGVQKIKMGPFSVFVLAVMAGAF